jgi:hypothetical protein
MQPYKYATMCFYITHPNIARSNFVTMPAPMHPIWDMYWTAMDMTESLTARKAVIATRKLFEDHPNKMPMQDKVIDVALIYRKFRLLKHKVEAVLKLVVFGKWKDKIKYMYGQKLYDGTYFMK